MKLFKLSSLILCCLAMTGVCNAQSTQYIPQGSFSDIPSTWTSNTPGCEFIEELGSLSPEGLFGMISFNYSENREYINIVYRGYYTGLGILVAQSVEDFMDNSSTEVFIIERRNSDISSPSTHGIELVEQEVDEESVRLKFKLLTPSVLCQETDVEIEVRRQ